MIGPLQVFEHHDTGLLGAQMLEEGSPGSEQLIALHARLSYAKEHTKRVAHPLTVSQGDELLDGLCESSERGGIVFVLHDAGPTAHHFSEGPESHSFAIGG